MSRQTSPREVPLYSNLIHGRRDYENPSYDGEPSEDIESRARIFNAVAKASPNIRQDYLKRLGLSQAQSARRMSCAQEKTAEEIPKAPPSGVLTIWHHGGKSYSVAGSASDPVCVTAEEDWILQAFFNAKHSMGRKELEAASGVTNAPRVLTQLVSAYDGLFKLAIRRPGRRRNGGYYAKVLQFQPHEQ